MFIFLPIIFLLSHLSFFALLTSCFCTNPLDSDMQRLSLLLLAFGYFNLFYLLSDISQNTSFFYKILCTFRIFLMFRINIYGSNSVFCRPQLVLFFIMVLKENADSKQRGKLILFVKIGSEASLLGLKFLLGHYVTFGENLNSFGISCLIFKLFLILHILQCSFTN